MRTTIDREPTHKHLRLLFDTLLEDDLLDIFKLNDREKIILHQRWKEGVSYQDIGYKLNLTNVRVSQLYDRILSKMQNRLVTLRNSHQRRMNYEAQISALKARIALLEYQLQHQSKENEIIVQDALNFKLNELELSHRTKNCLSMAKLKTLGELTRLKASSVKKIYYLGERSFSELENLLHKYGLGFVEESSS